MNIPSLNSNLDNFNNARTQQQDGAISGLRAIAEVDVAALSPSELEAIKAKTQEFEGLFIKMMFDEMRKSLNPPSSGSMAHDQGRDIFNDMLHDQYAQMLSRSGGIGIADMIFRQLTTPVIPASEIARRYGDN
ncbi:MAG: rod-binding protein [Spirochaetaceae bacterium]|nr:rod-binding protein [Spirochaetaceae bacterium]